MSEPLDRLCQSLDQGWSLGSDAFNYICALAANRSYRSLIEFGSGSSTIGWPSLLPDLMVTSFEHDSDYCEETKRLVLQYNLGNRVSVHHAPLRISWMHGRPYQTYARPEALPIADIVVIDGPPAYTRRGREACLYYAYDCLQVGGLVVLDDADRPDEQQTVSNWMSMYPGSFRLERVNVGHGLAVLYKVHHVAKNWRAVKPLRDSYVVQAEKLVFSVKRALAIRLFSETDPEDDLPY